MRLLPNAIVALSLASSGVAVAAETAVTVHDTPGLNAALKAASAGETILLAPGRYDGVSVNGLEAKGVTVASANPGKAAVLGRFYVNNSSGLTFQNLVFSTEGATDPYPFRVNGSSNITFTNLSVHGSMDGDPQDDVTGIWLGHSNHVVIKNSEFQELLNGIVDLTSTDVLIDSNYIHDIGTDGIDNGGSSNVTITNNYLADFHFKDAQHPDAIQFWTAGMKDPAKNITVAKNLIERGKGTIAQGVFMGNEAGLQYSNVAITDNLLVGTLWNGIAVDNVDRLSISGNDIESLPDQASWIVLRSATNASLAQNRAQKFTYIDTRPKETKNRLNDASPNKGAPLIAAWKAAHAGLVYGPAAK